MNVSIIIPTYNEAQNIKLLIPQIEKTILKRYTGEIIVVDDSSPDGTSEVAQQLNKRYKNIRVILRTKKEGIGAALREGYNAARGDVLISTDADLSFAVADMEKLLDKIHEGYDLVVGNRHGTQGFYEQQKMSTKIKGFVSKYGNILVRWLSGLEIHDTSANFRAIKRRTWNRIHTTDNTNSLLLEMILKTMYCGYNVTEIPVTFKERIYGLSKINLAKEVPKYFMKLMYYVLFYRFYEIKRVNKDYRELRLKEKTG